MKTLHLRFCDHNPKELALDGGVHRIGRQGNSLDLCQGDDWLLQVSHDRRGIWLTVAEGLPGVHVNGRPVQQMAMLRAGDCIHADGHELLLMAADASNEPLPESPAPAVPGNLRLVLRGVGGACHGRSIRLDKSLLIGSGDRCTLRIDGHGVLAEHARIEDRGGRACLTHAMGEVRVNGRACAHALLHDGDQIAIGTQHRFVLEGTPTVNTLVAARHHQDADADAPPQPPRRSWAQRVPWLLVSAVLLAGALTALLAFGAR